MATIRIGSRLKCRGMVEVNKVCVCNLKVQLTLISEIKELQKLMAIFNPTLINVKKVNIGISC